MLMVMVFRASRAYWSQDPWSPTSAVRAHPAAVSSLFIFPDMSLLICVGSSFMSPVHESTPF